MNSRVSFAVILIIIAIVGVWLTVTGKMQQIIAAITGSGTSSNSGSSGSSSSTTSAPATTGTNILSGTPSTGTTTASTTSSNLLQSVFASVQQQSGSSVGNTLPAYELSAIDGPIGGDGYAIAPITLSSWAGGLTSGSSDLLGGISSSSSTPSTGIAAGQDTSLV